jgi:hypothetical protein
VLRPEIGECKQRLPGIALEEQSVALFNTMGQR